MASYRLGFERLPADYGDPDADNRLARSVAAGPDAGPDAAPDAGTGAGAVSGAYAGPDAAAPRMEHYLRLRTAFFDRVVINAVERGVTQLVAVGAGYDGRSLRYGHPSVRWFEVDHPATSADKQRRLASIGADASDITFLAWDLARPGLAGALVGAGFDPDGPAQFLCEGVVVYLEPATVDLLLRELRALCAPRTRLALSLSVDGAPAHDPPGPAPAGDAPPADLQALDEYRALFGQAVARLGEPVRSAPLTVVAAQQLFVDTGWMPVDVSERSGRAGLVVLKPLWVPVDPPTIGVTGRFTESVRHRRSTDRLGDHIAEVHGRVPSKLTELDIGVFRVDFARGASWVARITPPSLGSGQARQDADLLRTLEAAGFPAERPAVEAPVSELDGQGVLVTERIAGRRPTYSPELSRRLARLLAQLHVVQGPGTGRPGGAWHHLVPNGDPGRELAEAGRLVDAARSRVRRESIAAYDALSATMAGAADLTALPGALVHPDFVVANALCGPGGEPRFVDWSGAGQGPRLGAFGCLLWGVAHKNMACVTAAAEAYSSAVQLTDDEVELLGHAILRRPLVLACWSFAGGRFTADEAQRWLAGQERMCRRATLAAVGVLRPGG